MTNYAGTCDCNGKALPRSSKSCLSISLQYTVNTVTIKNTYCHMLCASPGMLTSTLLVSYICSPEIYIRGKKLSLFDTEVCLINELILPQISSFVMEKSRFSCSLEIAHRCKPREHWCYSCNKRTQSLLVNVCVCNHLLLGYSPEW